MAPASRPDDGGKPSGLGCLNPLSVVKIVVVLLLVVLMPLYMLPLMLVRIATFGRTSVSYSSAINMTSGEAARRGYGALDPAAPPASVNAGLAAIAAHDPEFDPAKLVSWAVAATALIRQSLTSADATPTRTFMANALFRTYLALLELRVKAGVACTASWQVTDSAIVEAVSTPLFDEMRVRLRCQGWCWEHHEATGLTLRGGQQQRTRWLPVAVLVGVTRHRAGTCRRTGNRPSPGDWSRTPCWPRSPPTTRRRCCRRSRRCLSRRGPHDLSTFVRRVESILRAGSWPRSRA